MRAISLWQPWASLWCSEAKIHETRHWSTKHRGWLLVHAAKRRMDDIQGIGLGDILDSVFGPHWGLELPRGAIIGKVYIVDCVPVSSMPADHAETDDYHCGDFSQGRFAWLRDAFHLFSEPIPYLGRQGFFAVPDSITAKEIEGSGGEC